jgi:membrane fusion protein (multidrug efflux system)
VNTPARQQISMEPAYFNKSTDVAMDEPHSMEEQRAAASIATFPGRQDGREATGDGTKSSVLRRPWMLVLLALLAGFVAWTLTRESATSTAAEASVPPPPLELAAVDIAVAEPRVLTRALPLSGTITPVVQATVKAKVSGEIEAVTVREGQDVAAGDVIARIDTRNLRAEYERELANVEKARAELQLAALNRDKNRALLEQRFISQNVYESTESAYAGAVAALKLAEAQARLAKISLDDAVVRAPFSGTIARRLVEPGEKVSPDSSIVTLVDLRQMLLSAAVPAVEIPSVEVGHAARFRVGGFGARDFEGTVQRINPVTEDGSRAISVYIAVPNEDRALKGGMFAQGTLQLSSTEPVLAIPQQAVRYEASAPYVYTLEDGKIARKSVTLGTQVESEGFAEVRSGLAAGDRVIVADIGERKPGSEATVATRGAG